MPSFTELFYQMKMDETTFYLAAYFAPTSKQHCRWVLYNVTLHKSIHTSDLPNIVRVFQTWQMNK